MTTREEPEISTGARVRWPLIVVGLLATHVAALLLAVKVAPAGGGHRRHPIRSVQLRAGIARRFARPIACVNC